MHAVLEHLFDLPAAERTPAAAVALLEPRWSRPGRGAARARGDDRRRRAAHRRRAGSPAAQTLVEQWFDLEDPTRLEPAARELYVETEVEGLTLRGYVDRLDVAPDGAMRVVDYKTGRSPSELFEAKALFQMKFYALVLWRIHGEIPRLLQLVYLGNGEVVRYAPDEGDLLAIERNIRAIWDAVVRAAQTGDWRPRTSRLCDWCDFRDLCPAWGGTPPPLPEGAGAIALDPAALRRGRARRRVTPRRPARRAAAGVIPAQAVDVHGSGHLGHRHDVRHGQRRHAGRDRRAHPGRRVLDGHAVPAAPRRAGGPRPGRARGAACRGRPRRP